jgi:hypothetical protein
MTGCAAKSLGLYPVSGQYRFRVRLFALGLAISLVSAVAARGRADEARGRTRRMVRQAPSPVRSARIVSVQPFAGPGGPALRSQVAQILRARGFRVVTEIPAVTGTAQYPGLARDHDVSAFVVGEIEGRVHTQSVTFLIWTGCDGSVADRWSIAAAPGELLGAVSRGFWPRLGRALARAKAPSIAVRRPAPIPPAPPMRIDAGDSQDEPIVSDGDFSGRRRRAVH